MASTLFYRFDLDKTYLATPLEHKLQLIKAPFEAPEAKRTLPGMNTLVRSLKTDPYPTWSNAHLTILSASPSFMAEKLKAKMELDEVNIDEYVFKDQWALIRRARFKEISDPFAYKLLALCTLGRKLREVDAEILVGDDFDMDPIIYTLYADLRANRVSRDVLEGYFDHHDVRDKIRKTIWQALDQMPHRSTVKNIFIRREKKLGPGYYGAFGSLLKSYDDTFQLALLLFEERCISETAVERVVESLKQRRWRKTAFAFSWRGLIELHYLERFGDIQRLVERLNLVPKRSLWEKLTTFGAPAKPQPRPADWLKIQSWRHKRDDG